MPKVLVFLFILPAFVKFAHADEPQYYKGGADQTPTYVQELGLDKNALFTDAVENTFSINPEALSQCLRHKQVMARKANPETMELNVSGSQIGIYQSECQQELLAHLLGKYDLKKDRYFNILVLGLDVPTKPKKFLQLDSHKNVPILSSRSDSINILSLDLLEGTHALFSIYRGAFPSDRCWQNTTRPTLETDRIITNLFTLGKRSDFIECIRLQMVDYLETLELPNDEIKGRLEGGPFAVHATIEIDVARLKTAMTEILKVAVANVGAFNEVRTSSGMTMEDLKNLPGVADAMRNRHDWKASGYQRAFNHAKFLTYSLGYVGKLLAIDSNILKELKGVYGHISSSLSLAEFNVLLMMPLTQETQVITLAESLRFTKSTPNSSKLTFVSPIEIYEFGPGSSALIYAKGQSKLLAASRGKGMLSSVETKWVSIPNPEYHEDSPFLKHTKGKSLPE
jgi:hypothetical protein